MLTIPLPGGFGTLEEICEIIVQKQLGYNNKPIVFLNTNSFYGKLFAFFEDIINQKFANKKAKDLYYLASTPEDAINYLVNYDITKRQFNKEELYTR